MRGLHTDNVTEAGQIMYVKINIVYLQYRVRRARSQWHHPASSTLAIQLNSSTYDILYVISLFLGMIISLRYTKILRNDEISQARQAKNYLCVPFLD